MSHPGSANCYQSGCREAPCRLAKKIAMSRYRAKRERRGGKITERGIVGGKLGVPVDGVRRELAALRALMTGREVARRAGISEDTVYGLTARVTTYVFPSTAAAIHSLWVDYCAPIPVDGRRWPSHPIRRAVVACYGSVNASPWPRDLLRLEAKGDVSTATGDKWADRLGMSPYELWADWGSFPLEEAG